MNKNIDRNKLIDHLKNDLKYYESKAKSDNQWESIIAEEKINYINNLIIEIEKKENFFDIEKNNECLVCGKQADIILKNPISGKITNKYCYTDALIEAKNIEQRMNKIDFDPEVMKELINAIINEKEK